MAEEAKPEPAPGERPPPPKPAVPSEAEIDSPKRNTLIPLFAIFVVTFAAWGAARFACNMHPPESHAAPKLSTERLTATPKDCAIEFVQRWRSHDLSGALEIATAKAAAELAPEKAACAANANQCARDREASAGRLTMATLIGDDGLNALVRVVTELKGVKDTYRIGVRRNEQGLWRVVAKFVDQPGQPSPAPSHS